jgi:hypothetical protein
MCQQLITQSEPESQQLQQCLHMHVQLTAWPTEQKI